jgi:hypothetical protein
MRISRVHPLSPILPAESQNQSGALSSLPFVSEFIESYWIPRGFARNRMSEAVFERENVLGEYGRR